MPGTISHVKSMTSPNDAAYELQPQHWNSGHNFTLNASGSEISGAFGNGGGVSFGLSADGNITASAPAAAGGINLSAGTTSNNLASVIFADSNGLAFGLGTGASSRSVTGSYSQSTHSHVTAFQGMTLAGNTAGTSTFNASNNNTLFFNGGNGITLSGNGSTVTISGITQSNQSAIKAFGVSNTGATAGNTGVSSGIDWVMAGSNLLTLSQSTAVGGPNTVWIQHPAWLTTADLSANSSNYAGVGETVGTIAGTDLAMTVNTVGVSIGYAKWITTARGSTDAVGLNTAQTNVTWTVNSSGLSLNAGGYAGTVSGFTGANISGTFTLNTAGFSQSLSVPATSSLVGADGLSISTNGSTISVRLNTLGAFEPMPLLNGLSTTYAPAAGTWYMQPLYLEQPISGGRWNIMVAHGSTASNFQPTSSASYSSNTTGTLSVTGSYERRLAFYSIGAAGNSTRLESVTSANWPLSFTHIVRVASAAGPALTVSITLQISGITSINSAGATTQSTFSTASAINTASGGMNTTALSSLQSKVNDWISSQLMIPIPFNTSLPAGNYYVGMMWNSASGSTSTGALLGSNINTLSVVNQYAIFGNTNTAARLALVQTAASSGSAPYPGIGFYSVSSAAPPATMAFSDIRTTASQPLNYINYVNSTF